MSNGLAILVTCIAACAKPPTLSVESAVWDQATNSDRRSCRNSVFVIEAATSDETQVKVAGRAISGPRARFELSMAEALEAGGSTKEIQITAESSAGTTSVSVKLPSLDVPVKIETYAHRKQLDESKQVWLGDAFGLNEDASTGSTLTGHQNEAGDVVFSFSGCDLKAAEFSAGRARVVGHSVEAVVEPEKLLESARRGEAFTLSVKDHAGKSQTVTLKGHVDSSVLLRRITAEWGKRPRAEAAVWQPGAGQPILVVAFGEAVSGADGHSFELLGDRPIREATAIARLEVAFERVGWCDFKAGGGTKSGARRRTQVTARLYGLKTAELVAEKSFVGTTPECPMLVRMTKGFVEPIDGRIDHPAIAAWLRTFQKQG